MYTLILIFDSDKNGVKTVTLDGYASREAAEAAGTESIEGYRKNFNYIDVGYLCINRQ